MKHLFFIALLGLLVSCEKDKVPEPTPPCTGVPMTGNREIFVGTWRWYETDIERWYDIGNSVFFKWTPDSVGYDYYFTLSTDGLFKGYRNDTLIHDYILNRVDFEYFADPYTEVIALNTNCTNEILGFSHYKSNFSMDTLNTNDLPLNFDDQENHLYSGRNYFVKQ